MAKSGELERPGESALRNVEMLLREYGGYIAPAEWDLPWVVKQLRAKVGPERRVGLRNDVELYMEWRI